MANGTKSVQIKHYLSFGSLFVQKYNQLFVHFDQIENNQFEDASIKIIPMVYHDFVKCHSVSPCNEQEMSADMLLNFTGKSLSFSTQHSSKNVAARSVHKVGASGLQGLVDISFCLPCAISRC